MVNQAGCGQILSACTINISHYVIIQMMHGTECDCETVGNPHTAFDVQKDARHTGRWKGRGRRSLVAASGY